MGFIAATLTAGLLSTAPSMGAVRLETLNLDLKSIRGKEGFFRVARTKTGYWWLLDANNQPFVMKGICGVNRMGNMGGRRAKPSAYTEVSERLYPGNQFANNVIERMRAWNFNTLGSWSSPDLYDRGMAYTEITEFNYDVPKLTEFGLNLPDVFSDDWLKAIDIKAKAVCEPLKNKKELVGYFTDNEFSWMQPREEDIKFQAMPNIEGPQAPKPTLLHLCLIQSSETGTYKRAWQFINRKYGSWDRAAKAWGVSAQNQTELAEMASKGRAIISNAYLKDQNEFSHMFARRYFEESAKAIRRYDPNHMVLGVRFGGPPGPVILDECKQPWVDVLSANNYRANMYERMNIYYQPHKMPVIIGEFSWAIDAFTYGHIEKDLPVEVKVYRMLSRGPRSIERALEHPGVVGYNWYRWVDLPNEVPPVSNGLISQTDAPSKHLSALAKVNAGLDQLRLAESIRGAGVN